MPEALLPPAIRVLPKEAAKKGPRGIVKGSIKR
jgi:hypothetical protein